MIESNKRAKKYYQELKQNNQIIIYKISRIWSKSYLKKLLRARKSKKVRDIPSYN